MSAPSKEEGEAVFERVEASADFPAMEREILAFWEEADAFTESNRRREGTPDFIFYDGPPFATGTPHYGHLLAGTIKDIVPRFWNMRGHHVERRFGWDCHGLPIEALAQEALGLAGTGEILDRGVDVFNEKCRDMVQTYVEEWRKTVSRMGRWVDFDNDYKTMDVDFMETVWWVFKQLWEKDRVYKSYRIMPYSCKLATPLSNFEANQNYKDVQDPSITIRLRVTEGAERIAPDLSSHASLFMTAWTTTPWTLPENLALCVGPGVGYVLVEDLESGDHLVFAEGCLAAYDKKLGKALAQEGAGEGTAGTRYRFVSRLLASDLVGSRYEPLFPYFADQPNSFVVLEDDFVTTEDGTGIVHMAPAYGEDDFRVCRAAGIDLVDPLDSEARFREPVSDYVGLLCKEADKRIIKRLKDEGKLLQQSTIEHSYPFCERTDTPLIYRAIEAWYVRVEDLRDDLVSNNEEIGWIPQNVGANRFGNWLKDANDWNISRNRFWGSCIPVWVNVDDPTDTICVGSRAELEKISGEAVDDLHKHIVDRVVIERDGKTYRRTPEVLDCWFESGSMPYAQQHFPFADPAGRVPDLDSFFPADFIAEGLDQTRGWFYTLLVLGTSLFGKSPYKNVIVNGLILASDGKKMSKRLKNYPDPNEILEVFGADALRAYMINSPVVRAEELRFDEAGLKEIVRTVVLPYWNVLSFFTTYAAIDGYDPRSWRAAPLEERSELDRWILSVLQSLARDVNSEMEGYRLYAVVPRLVSFIDDLTNWYIRRSRARFWKTEDDRDKTNAFATLYEVLATFSKILAPFMPFLTEEVYQRLVRRVDDASPASIHWCDYPRAEVSRIDAGLERRMATVRAVSTIGRRVREDHRIKVRQPLRELTVVHRDASVRRDVEMAGALIAEELNVKSVTVEADESAFASVAVKPNFKTLGKRCGPKLKKIGPALGEWGFEEVARLEAGESIEVVGEAIGLEDVLLQRSATECAATAMATDGEYTVVLDTALDDELRREGVARDAISLFNKIRKDRGFEVSDRVRIEWSCEGTEIAAALAAHGDLIAREILAVEFSEVGGVAGAEELELGGLPLRYSIVRHE
ncbi:MAG: isoleucine--tRNA ligase [bacterium]|nr:isoleucine--tRNA ligase [Deltaproteobacteria bacterium]MCP4908219.1 isoleucine--tRNA ligase [bacterium]